VARKKDEETGGASILEKLKADLEKKGKGVHVSILSKSDIARIDTWVSAPTYDLNRIVSGNLFKGIPEKAFTLLVGPEASFKSSFMVLCLAQAQKQGFTPVIIDTEGSWTNEFTSRWGLDADNAIYVYTPWVDQIMVLLGQLILNPEYTKLAIAIDSIGGIERLKLLEDAEKGDVKADQGTLQKDLKRMLKMLVNIAKSKKSQVYAGGHLYGNPSQYGEPEQLGGGFYLRLASDIIIALKKYYIKDDDKNILGSSVKAIARKNRYYPPFQEAVIEIDYQKGINPNAGLLDIALEAGIISGGGAGWYTINSTQEKFQGTSKFDQYVDEVLLKELDEWVQKSGYSTVNKNIAEAEKLIEESEEYKNFKSDWQKEE
jgi:recombination protein RecA